MKVLYISLGVPDYLCDTLMHGLYNLLGNDLTHSDDYEIMYRDYGDTSALYGKGFTVWGLLPDKLSDNSYIIDKIKNRYFDFVIYGSIVRCRDYLDMVLQHYPRTRIAFVNGEDDNSISHTEYGVPVFKRELTRKVAGVFPVSFSIPVEKTIDQLSITDKIKKLADYRPGSTSSYTYNTEEAYYNGYKEAQFGLTHKKAGWDCMRHYEILANGCLPYFPDLKDCPSLTMVNFPKQQILLGNELYEQDNLDEGRYEELLNEVFTYTKDNLTTVSAAKYMLDTLTKLN